MRKRKKLLSVMFAAALVLSGMAIAPTTVKADTADLGTAYICLGDTSGWALNIYRGTDGTVDEGTLYAGTAIDGDGTYTVSVSADDVGSFADLDTTAPYFRLDVVGMLSALGITADGVEDSGVTVSDVSVSVDGGEINVTQDAVAVGGDDSTDSVCINLINPWSDDADAVTDTYKLPFSESLSVTFTITGTGYESEANPISSGDSDEEDTTASDDAGASDDATTTTDSASATADDSSTGVSTGLIVVIVIVVVVVIAAVAAVVLGKKKK